MRRLAKIVQGSLLLGLTLAMGYFSHAANPAGGTVSEGTPSVAWTGPFLVPTASAACNGPNDAPCDNFRLTILPPSAAFGPYVAKITLQPFAAGDWDLLVFDPNGNVAGSSGNAPGAPEFVTLTNPGAGTYTVSA
ncbi:MAG: PPC domain-containing protein, partial [Candidatus Acidiferrales bacterium]